MTPCPPPARLLPHAAPMLLLDETLSYDADAAAAAVTIRADHPFARPEGVPAHVGIEFMAQTCGIWAGGEALRVNGTVRQGFLLGTRSYQAARPFFHFGERLEITARLVFRDQGMGVFDCRIAAANGTTLAEAQLSVYQPEDTQEST
ncbi:MAG TPA: hypothetical protein VK196_04345 [Magnetospirillum sp.]|nr:hypothetical protein [Magnetospirillum sp.]